MNKRYKDIILEDSRSENMVRRLLDTPDRDRTRRQRWLLFANGGWLLRGKAGVNSAHSG